MCVYPIVQWCSDRSTVAKRTTTAVCSFHKKIQRMKLGINSIHRQWMLASGLLRIISCSCGRAVISYTRYKNNVSLRCTPTTYIHMNNIDVCNTGERHYVSSVCLWSLIIALSLQSDWRLQGTSLIYVISSVGANLELNTIRNLY